MFGAWIPNEHVRKLGMYTYHCVMLGQKFYYGGVQRAWTVTVVFNCKSTDVGM